MRYTKIVLLSIALLSLPSEVLGQAKNPKKEKAKPVVVAVAPEFPAEPNDPFYKFTVGLETVDKVELMYLSAEGKEVIIDATGTKIKIASRATLTGSAAEEFAALWRKLLRGNGAGCFAPAYSIRFLAKDKELLGTNVCYHCRNLLLPGENGSGITGFNARGKSGQELLKKLQELLPESKPLEQPR